jgi:hypothetical protein
MIEALDKVAPFLQFLFIVAVPLVVVAGGLVTLFAVGALFDALEHPGDVGQRIQRFVNPPLKPPKTPGEDHYYKPYWASR